MLVLGVNTLMVEGHPTTAFSKTHAVPKPGRDAEYEYRRDCPGFRYGRLQVDDVSVMTSSPALMVSTLKNGQNAPQLPAWTQDLSLFRTPNEGVHAPPVATTSI